MNLEFKQIACYFPYELKIMQYRDDLKLSFESILISLSNDTLGVTSPRFPFNEKIQYHEAKPILRPLSDLDDSQLKSFNFVSFAKDGDIDFVSYDFMKYAFENHFDVFGLIDKGLAIDINTINQ